MKPRQLQLQAFPGMDQVFLALEAFKARPHVDSLNPGQRACVRLTVSHPDPDRHIAVVMDDAETWRLFTSLGEYYREAFGERFGTLSAGADGKLWISEPPPGPVHRLTRDLRCLCGASNGPVTTQPARVTCADCLQAGGSL